MFSCIKKISQIIFILTLVLGFVSCQPEGVVSDTTAPGSVKNVNAESEEGKIVLTWTDPSDSDLLGIKIYNGTEVKARAVSFSDGILIGKGIQKYEIANLEDGKEYTFRISAVDNALNESESVVTEKIKFSLRVVEIEKTVFKYVCPKDKKEFATAEEAANCCGVQTIEVEKTFYKYICPKDKKEFDTAEEAADCCGVQIEYVNKEVEKIVKKYICPRDSKEYDTAEEAENCCGPVELEKLVYSTTVKDGTYTVYHFQQKTSGGKTFADYTLYATEDYKAVAENSTLENLKKTYIGFTAKALAQNETTLYIFYDRNIITYTFRTGTEGKFADGKTEKTVSGLYGTTYQKPADPTSRDYVFEKWVNDEKTPPSTFDAESKIFSAMWTEKFSKGEVIPDGFVRVQGIKITGTEGWNPTSNVFIKGRSLTIPDLIVCDHEVTRGEYKAVVGKDPIRTVDAYNAEGTLLTGNDVLNNPVNGITWFQSIVYCNKLSIDEGLTPCYTINESTDPSDWGSSPGAKEEGIPVGDFKAWEGVICNFDASGYRLPTEAEWEWLARGGDHYEYAGSNKLDDVGWCYENNQIITGSREVKSKQSNSYGLYDMSGNVGEFCWDWNAPIVSSTPASGNTGPCYERIQRGGAWDALGKITTRTYVDPSVCGFIGFRVVRTCID